MAKVSFPIEILQRTRDNVYLIIVNNTRKREQIYLDDFEVKRRKCDYLGNVFIFDKGYRI